MMGGEEAWERGDGVSPIETERGKGFTPSGGTESAARVADVLLTFAGTGEAQGVSEISRRLGVSKAVVHRILRSLASRRLVTLDETSGKYRLGLAAVTLGARALRDIDIRAAALPVLRRLQVQSGETATVSELVGVSRVYLDQVPSSQEIKMTVEIGRPFPLHAGASSRAILAFAPSELRLQILGGPLEALTPKTIVDRSALEESLSGVREAGTAVSFGERQPGAASVASPLLGPNGNAIGSLSVCGPVDRFDKAVVERLLPLVGDAAHKVSSEIAGHAEGGQRL
jgi:DNA-binding IclR family transcriptional regulator